MTATQSAVANAAHQLREAPSFVLVPDASSMTDEQAEAIANVANCCGGTAYDIYRAAIEAAPRIARSLQSFTPAQRERLYRNRPANVCKGISLADWHRAVEFVESAHGITQKKGTP